MSLTQTHVRHVMATDLTTVQIDEPPSELRARFSTFGIHHIPVLKGKTLVGIVSTLDLARLSLEVWVKDPATRDSWLDEMFKVRDLMTFEPEVVHPDDTIRAAADKLAQGNFHALPVVDDNTQLVGMITSTDLLRLMVTM